MFSPPAKCIRTAALHEQFQSKSDGKDQLVNKAKEMNLKLVDGQFERSYEAALNCEKSYLTYKKSRENACKLKMKTLTGIIQSKVCGYCQEMLLDSKGII